MPFSMSSFDKRTYSFISNLIGAKILFCHTELVEAQKRFQQKAGLNSPKSSNIIFQLSIFSFRTNVVIQQYNNLPIRRASYLFHFPLFFPYLCSEAEFLYHLKQLAS